jgi:hypothetical protein
MRKRKNRVNKVRKLGLSASSFDAMDEYRTLTACMGLLIWTEQSFMWKLVRREKEHSCHLLVALFLRPWR